jgi:hypothetical protein
VLCHFADRFPAFVAAFLQHGQKLRRRFREESVTDLMMGSLLSIGGAQIVVEFPDEPATGADMEWNFVNWSDKTFFRLLIQAKQLYGDGKVWTRHCYKELLHRAGPNRKLQAEVLCDTARARLAAYPLYIFYHPQRSCDLAHAAGSSSLEGINLADGYLIEALANAATTQALRTRNKRLGTVHRSLFSLADLFCPSTGTASDHGARAGRTFSSAHDFVCYRRVRSRHLNSSSASRSPPAAGRAPLGASSRD